MFYFFPVLQAPFIKFNFSLNFKVGQIKNEVWVPTFLVREQRAEGRKSAGVRSISTFESSQRLHAGGLTPCDKVYYVNSYLSSLNIHPYPLSGIRGGGLFPFFAPGIISGFQTKSNLFARGFSSTSNLSPYYVSGFSDGDSSFHISFLKNKGYKTGFQVLPVFTTHLHVKDLSLLLKIQSFFSGVGVITKKSTTESVIYSVQSLKELNDVIVPQFDKYPLLHLSLFVVKSEYKRNELLPEAQKQGKQMLLTKKRADFILFKEVLELMNTREHLTMEGLAKIVNIKASMNKGLSEQLKEQFLDVVPVQRPIVEISQFHVSNPSWLIGLRTLAEAEGCFLSLVRKSVSHTIGFRVTLSFSLVQHVRDLELMQKIKECWGLGVISKGSSFVRLTVTKKSDIDTLITLFDRSLKGSKRLDFEDFSKIQEMVNNGLHKTEDGLNKILLIKRNMNSQRKRIHAN